MWVNLIGGSGSGCSTIGRLLAEKYSIDHIDADDLFHLPTDPPYQQQREFEERKAMAEQTLSGESWVLSGGIMGWGLENFSPTLVVHLIPPHDLRMERLFAREGEGADPEFIEWARRYEDGGIEGKTLEGHKEYLRDLECPNLTIEGEHSIDETLTLIEAALP